MHEVNTIKMYNNWQLSLVVLSGGLHRHCNIREITYEACPHLSRPTSTWKSHSWQQKQQSQQSQLKGLFPVVSSVSVHWWKGGRQMIAVLESRLPPFGALPSLVRPSSPSPPVVPLPARCPDYCLNSSFLMRNGKKERIVAVMRGDCLSPPASTFYSTLHHLLVVTCSYSYSLGLKK